MSTNVSQAARELAEKIDDEWELVPDNGFHFGVDELEAAREKAIESVAQRIQSAVKELVEKARECGNADIYDFVDCQHKVLSALAPWEVPEVGPKNLLQTKSEGE